MTAQADWIIDLGPGAGHDGGQVTFTGTPGQLIEGDALTRPAPEGVRVVRASFSGFSGGGARRLAVFDEYLIRSASNSGSR